MSDRSDRLRQRRSQVSDKVDEIDVDEESNESKPVKPDKTEEPDEPGEPDEPDKTKPKEEGEATQMWLPEDVRRELDLTYDEVNIRVQRDGQESLEKLIHWYPLIVDAGLDALEEMDATEIRERSQKLWD